MARVHHRALVLLYASGTLDGGLPESEIGILFPSCSTIVPLSIVDRLILSAVTRRRPQILFKIGGHIFEGSYLPNVEPFEGSQFFILDRAKNIQEQNQNES
jgi:hypothetical protein